MMSPNQDDPFLEAQADVLSTLNTTHSLFSSYLRIRSLASSASSPELAQARSELESTLHDLSTDLQDLVDSVRAVEGDPFRYGIDTAEVGRRRKLVEDVGSEVENMRRELKTISSTSSSAAAAAASSSKKPSSAAKGLPHPSAFDPNLQSEGGDDEEEEGGDAYAAFEQQRQVEMMQEQDEALDGVFQTVGNLRQQADDMGRELDEQAGMLDDVDHVAERVGGKLQTGIQKVGYVLKRGEGADADANVPTQRRCRAVAL
ncbi:MAG: hypothetical protein Q9167_001045 [Letrouitia subvulpina]